MGPSLKLNKALWSRVKLCAEAGGYDLIRLGGGEDSESKSAGEPLDGTADGDFQGNGQAGCIGVKLHLLDELGDDLGVGFSDEFVTLGGEFALEFEVVFHDAVVDYDDAAGAIAVGVRVLFRGAAVSGPAGVADAVGALKRVLAQHLFKVGQFAWGAADLERGAGRTADSDTRRFGSAVFEAP